MQRTARTEARPACNMATILMYGVSVDAELACYLQIRTCPVRALPLITNLARGRGRLLQLALPGQCNLDQ